MSFNVILDEARKVFEQSLDKYGPSFLDFRLTSLTDQIFIKLLRIKNFEESGTLKVDESIRETYLAAVNYSIIALMLIKSPKIDSLSQIKNLYSTVVEESNSLRENKNSDYAEAWKLIRISSMTDIMIVKVRRLKTLEDLENNEVVNQSIKDCYTDILNYSVYSLLRLE